MWPFAFPSRFVSSQESRVGVSLLGRVSSIVRPVCSAFISPTAVVLEVGGQKDPTVRACRSVGGSMEARWEGAVLDLLDVMAAVGVRGRRLRVWVADDWVRPVVLPLMGQMPDAAAMDTWLTGHYQRVYGPLMVGWRWCYDLLGDHLLVVAWPAAGLDVLRQGCDRCLCRLVSVRPLGVDVAGVLATQHRSAWFAVVGRSRVSLLRCHEGSVLDWCVVPVGEERVVDWSLQLEREAACRADDCRTLVIVDDDPDGAKTPLALVGWDVHRCAASQLAGSVGYRLARWGWSGL